MATPIQTQQNIDAHIAQLKRELVELKRQRNELSPISTVPPKILCHILLLATSCPHPRDPINFFVLPEMLRAERCIKTLLHVSRSWRFMALECPELWAKIDVGITTDPRRIDFMARHAHSRAISLHINTVARVRSPSQLKWANSVKQLFSCGGNFNELILNGAAHLLLNVLRFAQPRTRRTLQVTVSDDATFGYDTVGTIVAQQPLFVRETQACEFSTSKDAPSL